MALRKKALYRVFDEVSLGAPENAIGFVLWRINSQYQREMDRTLASTGLSNLQFVTLALVGWFEHTGAVATQIELSRFGGIHPMQLSQMLSTLDAKQLVRRKRSMRDSRAKIVTLTAGGLAVLKQAFPIAVGVQRRLFGRVGQKGGALLKILLALDAQWNGGAATDQQPRN